jgi:hypothetical protein
MEMAAVLLLLTYVWKPLEHVMSNVHAACISQHDVFRSLTAMTFPPGIKSASWAGDKVMHLGVAVTPELTNGKLSMYVPFR